MPRAPRVPVELTRGPFDLEEAGRYGLTRYHLRAASWRSLGNGFYAVREIADWPLVRLAAAVQRLPSAAVFSGRTAAWLHGLDVEPCNPIEATVPFACSLRRLAGISIERSAQIEMSIAKGLPVTPRVRTVADLGRHLPLLEAVVAIDMALHSRLVTAEQLRRWVETHVGYRGISRLRQAMDLAEPSGSEPDGNEASPAPDPCGLAQTSGPGSSSRRQGPFHRTTGPVLPDAMPRARVRRFGPS